MHKQAIVRAPLASKGAQLSPLSVRRTCFVAVSRAENERMVHRPFYSHLFSHGIDSQRKRLHVYDTMWINTNFRSNLIFRPLTLANQTKLFHVPGTSRLSTNAASMSERVSGCSGGRMLSPRNSANLTRPLAPRSRPLFGLVSCSRYVSHID